MKRCSLVFLLALGATATLAAAEAPAVIDLPTALRLADAKNLEIELAREKLVEARAAHDSVRQKYFPWIAPAVTFRRHEKNIQSVEGRIFAADKNSLSAGLALTAQLDLGETYFQNLVARRLVRSGEAALEVRRRETAYRAAVGYFDLARAHAAVGAATEAAAVATRQAAQLAAGAEAGLAFQGDVARSVALRERSDLALTRLRAERRVAAARLAEILRLDPAVELTPAEADLAPLALVAPDAELGPLIARALSTRPELDEAAARLEAARAARRGATQGALIPTLGAQAILGGLGGGTGTTAPGHDFDTSRDYAIGLSWRVGPGGLFDRARERETASRERQVALALERTRDSIRREVVEQHTRLRSLSEQLGFSRRALAAADQSARLSRQRRETGVSAVFEDLQTEEELARARRDYLATVADYNQAQYALRFATGEQL
jgi:outer membrane protein TolC